MPSEAVTVGIVTAVGPTLIGLAAFIQATFSKREAAAVNRAVNHVDDGKPTLYEHASSTAEALAAFTEYQHDRNHDLMNQVVVIKGRLGILDTKVERHLNDDATYQVTVIERLDGIDTGLIEAKELAEAVKHDLIQFNEIDRLGREGRVDRRSN